MKNYNIFPDTNKSNNEKRINLKDNLAKNEKNYKSPEFKFEKKVKNYNEFNSEKSSFTFDKNKIQPISEKIKIQESSKLFPILSKFEDKDNEELNNNRPSFNFDKNIIQPISTKIKIQESSILFPILEIKNRHKYFNFDKTNIQPYINENTKFQDSILFPILDKFKDKDNIISQQSTQSPPLIDMNENQNANNINNNIDNKISQQQLNDIKENETNNNINNTDNIDNNINNKQSSITPQINEIKENETNNNINNIDNIDDNINNKHSSITPQINEIKENESNNNINNKIFIQSSISTEKNENKIQKSDNNIINNIDDNKKPEQSTQSPKVKDMNEIQFSNIIDDYKLFEQSSKQIINENKNINNNTNNSINNNINNININDNTHDNNKTIQQFSQYTPIPNLDEMKNSKNNINNIHNSNNNNIDNNEQSSKTPIVQGNIYNNFNEKNNNNFKGKKKDKKLTKISIFDNHIITPYITKENKVLQSQTIFPIFEDYLQKSKTTISLNSKELILTKISMENKNDSYIDLVFDSYEDKILLSIKPNPPLTKINIKEKNIDEIEEINNYIEGNKNVNFFKKKESEIICQKPLIIQDEKTEKNINSFQEIFNSKRSLYEKSFSFDNNIISKLNNNIKNEVYLPNNNIIFYSYLKKNIKDYIESSNDTINKINLEEEDEIDINSIFEINERRLNKIKFTRRFEKPSIDYNRINFYNNNFTQSFLVINKIYDNTNIKFFSIENDIKSKELNIDCGEDIFTQILLPFKHDEIISSKNNLDDNDKSTDITIENIHSNYTTKYYKNVDLNNYNYFKQNIIDVFDDIDIESNYEKLKQYKNKRIKRKKKYLCSGDASIELMKSNLINEQYNNTETSLLHNLSIKLNEINNKSGNEEIKQISNISLNSLNSSKNNKKLRGVKKLKNEINNSLLNKKFFKNKSVLINKNNLELSNNDYDDNISLNKSEKNDIMKDKNYEKMIKKIKKSNNDINKIQKKQYINKLKIQQDNNFDKEIKARKKYKYLFPFFIVVTFLITYYNKIMQE